jgi:integrase
MPLKPEKVSAAIKSGVNQKLIDGRGLYFVVKNGRGFWVYQFWAVGPTERNPTPHGHTRSKCLGPASELTPAAARRERDAFAVAWREGREVATPGRKSKGELFSTAATAYLDNHADEWSARTRSDNKSLIARYVPADFTARPVTTITFDHVADVRKPIWDGPGNNRGSRLRRLIEGILSARDVHPNPARWDGPLKANLTKKRPDVTHRPSMPATEVPAFFATLGDDVEDRAGRFVALTAARRKEALAAKWAEFDFANRVWNIPAERMKMKRPHAVPLTDAMIDALGKPGAADAYVFPSSRTAGMLGHKALDKEWVPNGYTLHGFRTSLSTWAQEQDDGRMYPETVIKAAIAHNPQDNEADASYLRSDHFKARCKLMEHWSRFVTGNCK